MDELEHQVNQARKGAGRWANVGVMPPELESADTPAVCIKKWQQIYRLFGATGETMQDEVFAAVNMYFLANGCSPKGKYSKSIRTSGGVEVPAGEVVKVIGRLEGEIRQFMRGRLLDSYLFLKNNPNVADARITTRAQNVGVPLEQAWLLADWLGSDCEYFVGDEAAVYNRLSADKIAAATVRSAVERPPVNRVRDMAPESRFNPAVVNNNNGGYNGDLF